MKYKLSICVVTMNRAKQLKEALESCLACQLPEKTEFVVIDNASSDNTEQIVHDTLGNCGFDYFYEKLPKNIGAGVGRNYAFSKSRGEYTYGSDDDAVIAIDRNPDFFIRAIQILDQNPRIVTLATQIYDQAWKRNRIEKCGPEILKGISTCKMFCGGSHFLRRSFFADEPYLPNKYGYEELPPSLRVMDAGMVNAFCPDLLVIHKPAVNKWDWSEEKNHELLINEIAIPYAVTLMMYPIICRPVLWAAIQIRIYRYLRKIPGAREKIREIVKEVCRLYPIGKKIKLSTVCRMVRVFGLSVF